MVFDRPSNRNDRADEVNAIVSVPCRMTNPSNRE
jgi:hypothetical protein